MAVSYDHAADKTGRERLHSGTSGGEAIRRKPRQVDPLSTHACVILCFVTYFGMPMTPDALATLALRLRQFAAERDWDQFHSPKNLAMALTGEAGELAAEFQWLSEAQSWRPEPDRMTRVQEEAADVLLYLVRLADQLKFDLMEAADRKIGINESRYPADKVFGSARKYDEY